MVHLIFLPKQTRNSKCIYLILLRVICASGTLGLTFDGRDVEEPGDVVPEEQHEGVLAVVLRVPRVGLGDAARAEEPVAAALVL